MCAGRFNAGLFLAADTKGDGKAKRYGKQFRFTTATVYLDDSSYL